ncbi:nitrogenase iron-molybdenum cofactor biosynthesis protein NifE [Desulfosporosinus sp. BICA1-9]|uniref:nitrogenase iron-molybdenum cofactor biosynthesis protein NifE n=1 Tax=Desulfosporosinus sp. BICA1-9 TaxID=1531958 RepID=UPI00054B6934|nr:nitrogenase iron-molybdenum cofactor biosynthesis protein NifE [Desulfosporosinus sp. BICA1-9]KJS46720.1 MAG: nitrogenase iron-molybdenum cofactor biosynthesis protein NifE [Peptococcaceae bacterium BRH_c23]KJS88709.1 MAG: nitrogenase iron-molybdenum cofactor biosynthesis protein NifE [Desulfosporosinus sp. BICA1-9]HBW35324.1 nitrogenase iron-molybdenum cofactor biosynthesis protein NifE [Desulfosporosinus sp.]
MFTNLTKLDLKDKQCMSDAGSPKLCMKALPGEGAERSCAYDGARVVLMPITDVAHLVHGPIACAGNSWDNRGARSSGSQLYRRGLTTDIMENDVIYGGETKLKESILEIAVRHEPKAIFVYATCVSSLIGDDVDKICQEAQAELTIPVIAVNCPGFLGDKNIGNRIAGEVLFDRVIGTGENSDEKIPLSINLIGEYNIAGDLWGVLPDLKNLGITLHTAITGDANFDDLRSAHRASLNVLICSKSLTNLVRKMEIRYGIPFMEGSFYGIHDTSETLIKIAKALGDPDLVERTLVYVRKKEDETRKTIAGYKKLLENKQAILFTGGVKTWSMVSTLAELGINILAGGTQNSTPEDFQRMKELMDPSAQIIEDTSSAGFLKIIAEKKPDLIVAGGKTKYLAHKTRTPFLDINHGRKLPYAGYEGMVTFAETLTRTVLSPVWGLLRQEFPPKEDEQDD